MTPLAERICAALKTRERPEPTKDGGYTEGFNNGMMAAQTVVLQIFKTDPSASTITQLEAKVGELAKAWAAAIDRGVELEARERGMLHALNAADAALGGAQDGSASAGGIVRARREIEKVFIALATPSPAPVREDDVEQVARVAQALYERNPRYDQEVVDGRPMTTLYRVSWDQLSKFDSGLYEDVLEDARAAIAAMPARLSSIQSVREEALEAADWLAKHADELISDVKSGHQSRANAASEWMREDDRDFLRDLRKHLTAIRALKAGDNHDLG